VERAKRHSRQLVVLLDRLLGIHARPGHGEIVLILSYPRSGTTMLGTAFESLGSPVHYYGELIGLTSLTPDLGIVLRRRPRLALALLRGYRAQRGGWTPYALEADHIDVNELLGTFSQVAGLHVAKVFWNHLSDAALARALEAYRPTIIFLRRNHYDRLVSHLLARQNDAWHGRSYANDKVEVTEQVLQSYADEYSDWYRRSRRLCDELGLHVIDIGFEELVSPGALQELIAKVCGDAVPSARSQAAQPATKRQGAGSTLTSDESALRERFAFPALGAERA
jgi:LPS sulfotransferase NodH